MFLQLAYTKPDVFPVSKQFVLERYRITKAFLQKEKKFAMLQQIRRSPLSVHLNRVVGCSCKPEVEQKPFFEVTRGAVIEINTSLNSAVVSNCYSQEAMQSPWEKHSNTFKPLINLIRNKRTTHHSLFTTLLSPLATH